ncbi:succinylglutamate desuccinylase/aspartoacylase domain-containing protein [Haladaptatus sp. ZSTT2]|uniref:succinylglutamate desuccinylase/aspartoacylase domain-containing protein n=1 Tax=Haladaptatus sp. ZSTT2 TaxID=3120515 RepID=UPI00300E86D2
MGTSQAARLAGIVAVAIVVLAGVGVALFGGSPPVAPGINASVPGAPDEPGNEAETATPRTPWPTPEPFPNPDQEIVRQSETQTVSRYSLLPDTANETDVYVIESNQPGPTAVVVGGMHGNEVAGFTAAHNMTNWTVTSGTLVIIPEANKRAVMNRTRKAFGTDLNNQFPVGKPSNSSLANAIWTAIEYHDPDIVIDLHSSKGIFKVDEGSVGQAIFPGVEGSARDDTNAAIAYLNEHEVPDSMADHKFKRGNILMGTGHSLTRRAVGELGASSILIETAKRDTTLDMRIRWTEVAVRVILSRHGMVAPPSA